MSTPPDTAPAKPSAWSVFAGWHREPNLWREIYARTVSALTSVLVVYLVGAAAGTWSRKPFGIIGALLLTLAVGAVGLAIREYRNRHLHYEDVNLLPVAIRVCIFMAWAVALAAFGVWLLVAYRAA